MKIAFFVLFFICSSLNAQEIMIMGGKEHDVFLGYLNKGPGELQSIWNSSGYFGMYNYDKSIWNSYGEYGSEYGKYSPFNEYADYPPILVDENGQFYGYFTANKSKYKRAKSKEIDFIIKNVDKIRYNLEDYYELLFEK